MKTERRTATYVDLSHSIHDGMVTYKGLPAPAICDYWTREHSSQFYADDTSFQIGKIEMVANTGTYLDAPFHRFERGADLSELPLETLAELDGVLVSLPGEREVDVDALEDVDVAGKAVLLRTDWSAHWLTEKYFEDSPFLTERAAQLLARRGARLVGIDSCNLDDRRTNRRPAHTVLLGADIPIVEHLTGLDAIPAARAFKFSAVPPKIVGLGSFPVRAYASLAPPTERKKS